MPFDSVDPSQRLPDLEEGILQYWKEEDIFKRSIRMRAAGSSDAWDGKNEGEGKAYSFYDGPPFATGVPHYGHLLAGTIKDVIPRYQTMRGHEVQRRFGWDCHGLPIENIIEKENDIKDKQQIEDMGIGAFNDLCRSTVQRYTGEWRTVVERMGRFVDMDWDYRTMDPDYMESIWWVFSELHKKDLIYEGHKPMHICPRCVTPLSNFEVTQGYADITDQSAIAKFELIDEPGTFVLAWTTTPWTLPGNLLLAIHKKVTYVKVGVDNEKYIVAEDLCEKVFEGKDISSTQKVSTKELLGKKYTPLFPYFEEEYKGKAFTIVEADFVTTEDGTGVVHIAPGFGDDDFALGQRENLELLQHVRMDGTFIDAVTDFAGQHVKPQDDPSKTDQKIIAWLKENNKLFSSQKYKHSYAHCWRCDSPLLNYATSSWFVAVDRIKDEMLNANSRTEWVPSHVRDGRFGKWLENARDWAISRNRYWGAPLPIWRTNNGDDMTVVGSRDDLMKEKMIRFTKVTAIRHAESEGNLIPIYQGELPGTDLTKLGKTQAKKAGEYLQTQNVDVIYCSPLARTRQTAEYIAAETGAEVIIDDRLREVSFGEWEGKTVDFSDLTFLKERRAHKIDSGKAESIYHFDGMESWESVQNRIEDFMEEILPRHRGEHIVVVSHADPVVNIEHFFTKTDAIKLSHRPYPEKATPKAYFWDHDKQQQLDLHNDTIDDIVWPGSKNDSSVDLTLVRHGETDWNKEGRQQGHTDNPLNETGRSQALETANALKGRTFDVIISSDLSRSIETAEIIAKELGLTLDAKWPELRERSNGDWDGQKMEDVADEFVGVGGYRGSSFHHLTAPHGESLTDFLKRTEDACRKIQEMYPGKKVLLVSHGGTTRAILSCLENRPYKDLALQVVKNAEAIDIQLHPFVKRIPEVLDCWFESGSMPYAQEHYPFEMKHHGSKQPPAFPADFIAEGMDQTRGWFYTLTVLGSALFGTSPFKHCIVNGTVLAEDGKKMSKRLKNYPDPLDVVKKHGADAVRFTLMSSPAVRGEDLRFSEQLVEETVRNVLLPLWNTYSFFVTYANGCGFTPTDNRRHSTHSLDVWIRTEVQDLVNRMTMEIDNYNLSGTCSELYETIDALTNWYIRLSRRRFAGKGAIDNVDASGDQEEQDRNDALSTLYDVLLTISQALAPFCPFITDAIYLNLVEEEHHSIHMTDWPEVRELSKDEKMLLEKTRVMRNVVSLGNAVRSEATIKARQPLQRATIAVPPALQSSVNLTEHDLAILRQELNVKEVSFADNPEDLAESFVQVDARKVGPRLGGRVQEIIAAGKDGTFEIQPSGEILIMDIVLSPDEATLVYRGKEGQNVAADKGVVVSLDTEMTDELLLEGEARDIIRNIQRIRKESGFEFTDTITLSITGADDIMKTFASLIAQETKSTLGTNKGDDHTIVVGEKEVVIRFEKQ